MDRQVGLVITGAVLRTLLLHIISFFRAHLSPVNRDSKGTDVDCSPGESTGFVVTLLLELLPSFKSCGLSQLSDQIARPIGALIVGDGISAVSNIGMLRSLSKLAQVKYRYCLVVLVHV